MLEVPGFSGVLQGIRHNSDLCTRHATQIILRRAPEAEASVKVSIIPGPTANSDKPHKLRLQFFARTPNEIEFTPERFKSTLDEVRR